MVSTRSKSSTPSTSSSNKKVQDNSNDPDKITRRKPKRQKVKIQDIQWSVGQKKRLLSAMMKHGCSDYKAVAKEFPEFTKTAVKNMILLMIKKSKATVTNEDSHTLTGWKNTELYSEKKPMITKALKYISLFEKHPSPDECADCDFRALYGFLSNATLGRQILHSSAMTHETLWHVVESVSKEVHSLNDKEIRQYVIHDVEKISKDKNLQKTNY
ncbi:hypothetical protein HCN44_006332 [Aphidius gifuensis]|uniref:Uncharacterized protein n=1 Tax=Aphidius gifuensis TaxID=684658 RepID=A0A835CRG1_APHGI|nr:uncharacterized protein LOC122852210 [Aphidius gifuensis]KAF7993272.1 hypothetical protein HCN44_006332 [Aphidius gifuensis]